MLTLPLRRSALRLEVLMKLRSGLSLIPTRVWEGIPHFITLFQGGSTKSAFLLIIGRSFCPAFNTRGAGSSGLSVVLEKIFKFAFRFCFVSLPEIISAGELIEPCPCRPGRIKFHGLFCLQKKGSWPSNSIIFESQSQAYEMLHSVKTPKL